MPPHPSRRGLDSYRAKRVPEATPEPFDSGDLDRPQAFVVHKHAARRTHFDLRLELDGALLSWAVPKGPSLDPAEKRLAVRTEDHPLEYTDFEAVIPKGNYGAGAMIVWDRGQWVPHEDPREGLERGKLLFDLRGFKLRGLWTLVKSKRAPAEWLLIKKPDGWARPDTAGVEDPAPRSVLSGLTVEELAAGSARAAEVEARLAARRAPRLAAWPDPAALALAQLEHEPFSRPGWIFELKYDGYRMTASKSPAPPRAGGELARPHELALRYRSGKDVTRLYPDLARTLAALPFESLLLDGEVVVPDDEGRPDFQRLQQRALLSSRLDIERATVALPATLFAFDLLVFGSYDLRSLPLAERKEVLRQVLPGSGPLRFADHVEEHGREFYDEVRRLGLEGMLAKKADAPYRPGRTGSWIKVRADRVGDLAVVGYTPAKGSRSGFGALHLGTAGEEGGLVYAGRVGSGFDDAALREIRARLDDLPRLDAPPVSGAPAGREHRWVEPRLVAEVRYTEQTEAGQLRHPVFVRLREDKSVEEVRGEGAPPPPPQRPAPRRSRGGERKVELSRPRKVFWPDDGLTKGDLFAFYRNIAPWLIPFLADRPVVLDRYPDGIAGKSFFQKNAPEYVPEWLRTEAIWSEDTQREIDHFICDDVESLLFLINLGAIPLHVWSSRIATLAQPDWCILDLDPKEAPFTSVIEVALAIRELGEEIGLPTFPKTSGGSGLHVLVPLGRQVRYEQSRQLAEVLARVVARRLPRLATLNRPLAARGRRVYLDAIQNGWGKLLVSVFSARPLPGAPVSTPLLWSEVAPGLDPRDFTIRNVSERMRALGENPLAPVLELAPDLEGALERLTAKL